jgi:hypothetical protein
MLAGLSMLYNFRIPPGFWAIAEPVIARARYAARAGFAQGSPLEGTAFELTVPCKTKWYLPRRPRFEDRAHPHLIECQMDYLD